MSEAFAAIRDQDAALDTLRRAIERDRLASAYLFEGPSGVGKEATAMALAESLIAKGDLGKVARIRAGAHPDVRVFLPRDEGKRNIQVEFLRQEILPVAAYAPFEAEASFLIFPQADLSFPEHPPETANALLKTLEEPRPGVHFLLLAERPDRLLPTIRSRCQRLRFSRLSEATLEAILVARGVAEEHRGPAIALAEGRADQAIALAEEGRAATLFEWALRLDEVLKGGGPGELVDQADEIGKSEEPDLLLFALSTFYRDLAVLSTGAEERLLRFRSQIAVLRERAERLGLRRALERVDAIQEIKDRLERNANPTLLIEAMLYRMRLGP